jgi:hypothetical protein
MPSTTSKNRSDPMTRLPDVMPTRLFHPCVLWLDPPYDDVVVMVSHSSPLTYNQIVVLLIDIVICTQFPAASATSSDAFAWFVAVIPFTFSNPPEMARIQGSDGLLFVVICMYHKQAVARVMFLPTIDSVCWPKNPIACVVGNVTAHDVPVEYRQDDPRKHCSVGRNEGEPGASPSIA